MSGGYIDNQPNLGHQVVIFTFKGAISGDLVAQWKSAVLDLKEYADEIAAEDHVFEDHGVKVLVDPKSLPYIDGTQLDFVREGLNEGFKFHNPREKDRCGCGESFRV